MLDPGAQNLITEENLAGCPKSSVSIKKVLISTNLVSNTEMGVVLNGFKKLF